jgi:hypothetical protein
MSDDDDPIAWAYAQANHFQVLEVALRWERAACLLAERDPGAARLAWGHAIQAYDAYRKAYEAHMPASRWDHDFGPERSAAASRRREIGPCEPRSGLPGWLLHALEGRYTRAIGELAEGSLTPDERAVVALLAQLCSMARQEEIASRLDARAKG